VRFAPDAQVLTYKLQDAERDFKRLDWKTINQEYRREKRLYELVSNWKLSNKDAAANYQNNTPLCEFFPMERAIAASTMQLVTLEDLVHVCGEYVLHMWPIHEINHAGDARLYETSCVIVLNLVADFLCYAFNYYLLTEVDQLRFYHDVYHVTRILLQQLNALSL